MKLIKAPEEKLIIMIGSFVSWIEVKIRATPPKNIKRVVTKDIIPVCLLRKLAVALKTNYFQLANPTLFIEERSLPV